MFLILFNDALCIHSVASNGRMTVNDKFRRMSVILVLFKVVPYNLSEEKTHKTFSKNSQPLDQKPNPGLLNTMQEQRPLRHAEDL
jgi:hypothetical protein